MNFKRIVCAFLLVLVAFSSFACFAAPAKAQDEAVYVKSASLDKTDEQGIYKLKIVIANKKSVQVYVDECNIDCTGMGIVVANGSEKVNLGGFQLEPGAEQTFNLNASVDKYDKNNLPVVNCSISSVEYPTNELSDETVENMRNPVSATYEDILAGDKTTKGEAVVNFLKQTGFSMTNWQSLVMILIACVLMYLAIVKGFEPLLLLPIAFGMLLTNLCGAGMFHEELFADGHVHWDLFKASNAISPGLIDYLYLGVKLGIYPCLIFVGVGAMTDFGPLIANPKSLLLGAAAQVGIFATDLGA